MSTLAYIVIAIIVVVAVIAVAMAASRRRSGRLQDTFGPEYDRTVQQTGDRRQAERELAGRVDRRKQLTIVPLPEQTRQQYVAQWQRVQASFVDAPAESVRQADALVSQVMTDRGYPIAEFEQRAEDVSVDHAAVVENYRSAHAIAVASGQGTADTEALRTAMTQYRALFADLLGVGTQPPVNAGATPVAAPPAAPPAEPVISNRSSS
jgi:FtsZ-interacting cell division protein ZipA